MSTAFGIVLFVLVYAPIAYMVFDELTGRRPSVRSLLARSARQRRGPTHPQPASQYQQ
jgi:hypothetical protein